MSVRFKVFGSGRLAGEGQRVDQFYPLFDPVPPGKSYVVNAMRFVNTTYSPVTFSIALHREVPDAGISTIIIFPDNGVWPLGARQCAIEDAELTLGPNEVICGRVGVQNVIDFVISGIERDA